MKSFLMNKNSKRIRKGNLLGEKRRREEMAYKLKNERWMVRKMKRKRGDGNEKEGKEARIACHRNVTRGTKQGEYEAKEEEGEELKRRIRRNDKGERK